MKTIIEKKSERKLESNWNDFVAAGWTSGY